MQLPAAMLAPLEVGLNRYLAEDELALGKLARLQGKVLSLRLRELDLSFFLCPHAGGVQVLGEIDEVPDASIETSLPALARYLMQPESKQTLAATGGINIDGDVELVQQFLTILQETDFDPEEWLSRHIGDVAAYRAGEFLRGALDLGKRGLDSLLREGSRFLQEDSRDLLAKDEAREWMDDVDKLRSAVDRIEARLDRLRASAGYSDGPMDGKT